MGAIALTDNVVFVDRNKDIREGIRDCIDDMIAHGIVKDLGSDYSVGVAENGWALDGEVTLLDCSVSDYQSIMLEDNDEYLEQKAKGTREALASGSRRRVDKWSNRRWASDTAYKMGKAALFSALLIALGIYGAGNPVRFMYTIQIPQEAINAVSGNVNLPLIIVGISLLASAALFLHAWLSCRPMRSMEHKPMSMVPLECKSADGKESTCAVLFIESRSGASEYLCLPCDAIALASLNSTYDDGTPLETSRGQECMRITILVHDIPYLRGIWSASINIPVNARTGAETKSTASAISAGYDWITSHSRAIDIELPGEKWS